MGDKEKRSLETLAKCETITYRSKLTVCNDTGSVNLSVSDIEVEGVKLKGTYDFPDKSSRETARGIYNTILKKYRQLNR